jgi:hypothetical protein
MVAINCSLMQLITTGDFITFNHHLHVIDAVLCEIWRTFLYVSKVVF